LLFEAGTDSIGIAAGGDSEDKMAHVTGSSRYQSTLFAEVPDDMVSADHVVRVIDAFVDSLDLAQLGFSKVEAELTGRPPYLPGDLLKLYIYGYLNQIRSSRRLEREAARNVEVLWLINQVKPSFKTIAEFRRAHVQALVGACRAFVAFCRSQALLGGELVAIDGTKIGAVGSRKQVITPEKLAKRSAALDRKIAEHLAAMDAADEQENTEEQPAVDVAKALEALKARREEVRRQAEELARENLKQLVLSERDAKLMRTPHHGHQVAYNAQTAVDAQHGLIAAFDLTNDGNDTQQLHPTAEKAKEALAVESLSVVADTGYSSGEQAERCAQSQITAIVPRRQTTNAGGEQYFNRDRFTYDAIGDTYQCPAGQMLSLEGVVSETGKRSYANVRACKSCALKAQCTKGVHRVVTRSRHEEAIEAMHQRAKCDPKWMNRRRDLVEHPFGTIKWMMGYPRFLLRGLIKAKAELALSVLCYNLKRTINILGAPKLLDLLRTVPA
jgi:transposase/IS5 family transposase